jgi:hypothetical protein
VPLMVVIQVSLRGSRQRSAQEQSRPPIKSPSPGGCDVRLAGRHTTRGRSSNRLLSQYCRPQEAPSRQKTHKVRIIDQYVGKAGLKYCYNPSPRLFHG